MSVRAFGGDQLGVLDGPSGAFEDAPGAGSGRRRGFLARQPIGLIASIAFLVGLLVVSLLASWTAPYSPYAQDLTDRLASPSASHWLGTDGFGRDVFSRLIWGARSAYAGVAIAILVAIVLGIPWGIIAGYWRTFVGPVMMRCADALLAFPALVLAIAITGVLGVGLITSMVSVGIVYAPIVARLTCAGIMEVRDREFVQSAKVAGCKDRTILARHILPHAIGPVVVQLTILTGLAFIIESALAFLGLSVQPPTANWGADLAAAYQYILERPFQVLPPGLLIALVVLCVYRIGDALRHGLGSGGQIEEKSDLGDTVVA